MLGQITPETTVTLSLVCVLLATSATLINIFSNRRQRREVNFAFEPASKAEFTVHIAENKREHELLFSKINTAERNQLSRCDSSMASLRAEIKQDVHGIHERINEVLRVVSRLEGKVEVRKA